MILSENSANFISNWKLKMNSVWFWDSYGYCTPFQMSQKIMAFIGTDKPFHSRDPESYNYILGIKNNRK